MESRFAVHQTLHQLLQRWALRTSIRRRRRVGAGGSRGLVCCWRSQAKERATGESLLLVSISPKLLCLNHGYCAHLQHDISGDCRCLFSQLLHCVVSIILFLIYLSCARFIILASVPQSSSLKRWQLSFPGICVCLSKLESSPQLRMSFCPRLLPFIPFYHTLHWGSQVLMFSCSPLGFTLTFTVDVVSIFPLYGFSTIPYSPKPVPPDLHLSGGS